MRLHEITLYVLAASTAIIFAACATVAPEPTIAIRTELLPLSEEYEADEELPPVTSAAAPAPTSPLAPAPAPAPPPPGTESLARAAPMAGDRFVPGCAIPWENSKHWEISRLCPASGEAAPENTGAVAEYKQKNNLCAGGPAIDLEFAQFKNLQQRVEAKAAAEHLPLSQGRKTYIRDRATLKSVSVQGGKPIGEGTLVTLVGYVLSALTMNKNPSSSGESVNCSFRGAEFNDIHIEIGPRHDADGCEGIVVEMIPHFRPATWTDENVRSIAHPVRVAGPLFLDNRHRIRRCGETIPGEPKRMSLWEIHPVYRLDVCKRDDIAWCDPKINARWKSLDSLVREQ